MNLPPGVERPREASPSSVLLLASAGGLQLISEISEGSRTVKSADPCRDQLLVQGLVNNRAGRIKEVSVLRDVVDGLSERNVGARTPQRPLQQQPNGPPRRRQLLQVEHETA